MMHNTLIAIVLMLFDDGRRMMKQEIKGVSGILKTMTHTHILTEYLMKKKVAIW